MDDLYQKIVKDRGLLENIVSKIPGFRGYMEMSSRREADRTIRDYVASLYATQINRLAGIESDLVRGGGLMFMDTAKSVKSQMELLRRRVATDTPGYSGFFASNKIDAEDLHNVYAFDEAMIRYADEFSLKLDAFSAAVASNEGVAEAINDLLETAREANQAYDLRDDVLKEIN